MVALIIIMLLTLLVPIGYFMHDTDDFNNEDE